MAKGIFIHRWNSKYNDSPEDQYQFPKSYRKCALNFVNDWIIYYEPRRGGGRMGYTGIAKIVSIDDDPVVPDMFIAKIDPCTFSHFEQFVPFRNGDGFMETRLRKPDGNFNGGFIRKSIRSISDEDFDAIINKGFIDEGELLPGADQIEDSVSVDHISEKQTPFIYDIERISVEQTTKRPLRDRAFRKNILEAYDRRCAITGLQIINGGGQAEVEAAHIRPVKDNGPDAISNGIALSGTFHWMFDRGLIGLGDDLEILISRQANDPDQIKGMINETGRATAPTSRYPRPHQRYIKWHRDNCFKH